MSDVKCLIVKSCNGYINGLYSIVKGIVCFWNWIFECSLNKSEFMCGIWGFSLFAIVTSICILHPMGEMQQLSEILFLKLLGMAFGVPLIITPIYSAVYDCLVDEDLKIIES